MSDMKKYYLLRTVVSTFFGVGVGVLLLLLAPYGSELFDIFIIALGLLTAVINLPAAVLALRGIKKRNEQINFALALLSVLLGVALMLLQKDFLLLLLACYSLVLPIVRIVLAEYKRAQLRREWPPFFTGVAMLLVYLTEAESYLLTAGAVLSFVLSGLYLVFGLVMLWLVKECSCISIINIPYTPTFACCISIFIL
jgi:hypothetical protein